MKETAKWLVTMQVAGSNQLAYKLNFALWVLGPTLVFFFIKYNLWASIFGYLGGGTIQGYDLPQMLRYQGYVLLVAMLAQGYNSTNLAEDIRMGRISRYLIYPFQFWQFNLATFFAVELIQIVLTVATGIVLVSAGVITPVSAPHLVVGAALSILVSFFWFAASYALGLMAFWMEETWVLRVILLTVTQFLSGAVFPLEIYPSWLVRILGWLPFPYMTYAPVKVLMGSDQAWSEAGHAAAALVLWTLVVGAGAAWLWRRGMRLYTAAGM